jgi:hypothetical protein
MGLTNSKQNLSTLQWKQNPTENYESKINLNDNNVKWIIKNYGGEINKSELSTTTSIFISPKFLEGGGRKKKVETSTTQSNKFNKSSNISNKSTESNNMYNYTSSNISNSVNITENLNLKKDFSSLNSSMNNSSMNNSSSVESSQNGDSNNTISASNSSIATNDLNIISHPTTAH